MGEISAVFENGVFRPEKDPGLPNGSRVVLMIRRVEVDPESSAAAKETFRRIAASGSIRLDGWHPKRDELYDRPFMKRFDEPPGSELPGGSPPPE